MKVMKNKRAFLSQYFGTKRYLYQDDVKVAHMHIVNGVYYLHGHHKTKWSGIKLTLNSEQEFMNYIQQYDLSLEEDKQLTLF
ncbi:SAV1978 family virulence-associated passenger protein [Staphylococcus pasteuri]|uniref:SAV1978 family virulence-associated passenger protein n=1 Tax=Staphylococcus pasteuri TaxID=45972 RepID=UPI001BCDB790|nr:SAV1978 family virulence-associated passenger protein [Staphylococcus pasteuri]